MDFSASANDNSACKFKIKYDFIVKLKDESPDR